MECGAWGGLKEEEGAVEAEGVSRSDAKPGKIQAFGTETLNRGKAISTLIPSLDQVLSGGIVAGSVTLVAGEPGIGKSTLLAQAALKLAAAGKKVIYVTGEESPAQVHKRLARLADPLPKDLSYLDETDAGIMAATLEEEKPDLMIVDSVQTVRAPQASGEPGSVGQVKAGAAILTEAAKRTHSPIMLVGQVTKDGDVAGPRMLEHMVDTVLYLEGDREHRYRILRVLKHRFGSADETALFSLTERGLEPVEDPSSELLRDRAQGVPGSAVACLIQGQRPLLIELQALVAPAGYGTPVRRATGVDTARLGMLLAVLGRRAGVNALDKDVYANAAGGIDARDPSADLALCSAIASAVKNSALDAKTIFLGEVGLAGELRPVAMPEFRLKEAARLGFKRAIVPKRQEKNGPAGMELLPAASLEQALKIAGVI